MASSMAVSASPIWRGIRWVVWGGAACLLMLPAIAMRYENTGVNWSASDFVVMGIMFGLVCGAYELAVRVAHSHIYVVAAGIGVGSAFLQTWVNLAVGIIGNGTHWGNLLIFAAMLTGLLAAILSNLESRKLARAMEIMTVAQLVVTVVAAIVGKPGVFLLTGVFAAMWLTSAVLFRMAAQQEARAGATR